MIGGLESLRIWRRGGDSTPLSGRTRLSRPFSAKTRHQRYMGRYLARYQWLESPDCAVLTAKPMRVASCRSERPVDLRVTPHGDGGEVGRNDFQRSGRVGLRVRKPSATPVSGWSAAGWVAATSKNQTGADSSSAVSGTGPGKGEKQRPDLAIRRDEALGP